MMFRFTIARRLAFGFGILTIAVLASSISIYITLNKNRQISDDIIKVYTPSVSELNNLFVELSNSKMLIKTWVSDHQTDAPNKIRLREFHTTGFKTFKDTLTSLSKNWPQEHRKEFEDIIITVEDTLFEKHKLIMEQLVDFDSYQDLGILWTMQPLVEDDGEVMVITTRVLERLNLLLSQLKDISQKGNTDMVESFDSFQRFIVIIGFALFIVALAIAILTIKSIVSPINYLKQVLLQMQRGILPEGTMKVNNDEIGEMTNALNSFIHSLQQTSEFALEIGKGNYQVKFTPLSDEDILGNSLINMRENLQDAALKEQARKQEDEQRNWVTRGLAKFGDILRMNNDNMDELSYSIVSNLVKYLNANQGGMFILNDEDKQNSVLELTAAYAFDRKKFLKKSIQKGEGLVGTCLLEKQTILMTDIPDSYINITSGLGKANPRSLLIVPLKINEEIFGILELASFKTFERYQVEFVEKVGESIASTISSVKINSRTAKLLAESKEQSEQLIQQEEEMRQNLEELQSTQEESTRRVSELENSLEALNLAVASFEIDLNGNILSVNDNFAKMLGVNYESFVGKQHQMIIAPEFFDFNKYQDMLDELSHGFRYFTEHAYLTAKGEIWLNETYTPIRSFHGSYDKVIVIVSDITKYKNQQKD